MTRAEPLPLHLVRQYTRSYPGIWSTVAYMRAGKGQDLPDWNDRCYLPIAASMSIHTNYPGVVPDELSALAAWREYKEIYQYPPEFAELLDEQEEDLVLPVEAILGLPYPCVYIDLQGYNGILGFFAAIEQDVHTGCFELRLRSYCSDGTATPSVIHLIPGETLRQGIDRAVVQSIRVLNDEALVNQAKAAGVQVPEGAESLRFLRKQIGEIMTADAAKLLPYVLYICSDGTEIVEDEEQRKITRKPAPGANPKDVYREIRKWDVGTRYVPYLRTALASTGEGTGRTGAKKRPHTRRGHWHHYWTGSHDNRKLILRWTAPTFVGGPDVERPTEVRVVDKH